MRILAILALLLGPLSALADTATVVEGTRVNLRSGKSDAATVVKALEPATVMEVLRQEHSYVQVKTEEGITGWLPLRFVKIAPTQTAATSPKQAAPKPAPEELPVAVEQTQGDLKQSPPTTDAYSLWRVIGIGIAGLIVGILLGAVGLQAYYRRKLNGLRI